MENISIHMAEKTRDEWTSGYNGVWMNENDNTMHLDR
jgi:hypothetical protein